MADENDTPATDTAAPVPRRRAPRKAASKAEAAKPAAAKRASRPATTPAKKPAAKSPAKRAAPKPQSRTDRARDTIGKAADAAGGKRGLIAGGLVAVGAVATAALLSLRGSTPKNKAIPANDTGTKAHQPDGTDSSGQMEAMIADEGMIPESTPQG